MSDNPDKVKITVVDDEEDLVETIKLFLETRGYSVSFAYDGAAGLEVVKKEKPNVVILDIMMPGKDGRDMLKKMKLDEELKDIPVIMLTAKDEQFDRDYVLGLGAYEYVTKPYDSYALLRQIKNALEKKKRNEL